MAAPSRLTRPIDAAGACCSQRRSRRAANSTSMGVNASVKPKSPPPRRASVAAAAPTKIGTRRPEGGPWAARVKTPTARVQRSRSGPVPHLLSFLQPRRAISLKPIFRGRGSGIVSPPSPRPLPKRGEDNVQGVAHRWAMPTKKWARARQKRRKPEAGGGAAVHTLEATATSLPPPTGDGGLHRRRRFTRRSVGL